MEEVEQILKQGRDALEARDFQEAIACFQKVLDIDPANVAAVKYMRFAKLGRRGTTTPGVKSPARSTQPPEQFAQLRKAQRRRRTAADRGLLGLRREES